MHRIPRFYQVLGDKSRVILALVGHHTRCSTSDFVLYREEPRHFESIRIFSQLSQKIGFSE